MKTQMTNQNICWCEKCCLTRAKKMELAENNEPVYYKERKRVTFWRDSPNLLDPPAKSTAYFYKSQPPSKLTIVNLN
jgi:hypothetical protein